MENKKIEGIIGKGMSFYPEETFKNNAKKSLLDIKKEAEETGENIYTVLKKEGYIKNPMEEFDISENCK